MAVRLRALVALPESPRSIASTYMAAHKQLKFQLLELWKHNACMWDTAIHAGEKIHTHKTEINRSKNIDFFQSFDLIHPSSHSSA